MRTIVWLLAAVLAVALTTCAHHESAILRRQIDEYMNRMAARGFSGSLLVAKDGRIVLAKGYGQADRQARVPVTGATVFTIGSLTKQFTAAAVLKLQEMGILSVRDSLSNYFPWVPPDKRPITLHHLLTHTAGFPDAIGDNFAPTGREEFVALALRTPLLFAPGERYHYSNVGYSLLGALIEQITGEPYEVFLRRELFLPAGMKETGYVLPEWRQKQLAHGYRGDRDWVTLQNRPWAEDGPYWHLRANGGILSTVTDLYKWHWALESGLVLSDRSRQALVQPYVREGPEADSFYGYGWAISTTRRGTRLVAHNGGNGVFSADFRRYVDEGVVIICLANVAGNPAWRITETVARIVFGEPYTLPPEKSRPLDLAALQSSPVGRRALALLATLSEGDSSAVESMLQEHMAPSYRQWERRRRLINFVSQLRENQAPLALLKAEAWAPNSLQLTLRSEKTGQWWELRLEFEEQTPRRITLLQMSEAAPAEPPVQE
ncbi:MAG: serine hydrolase domain-containing protein [Candidatus Oleimicrobiaceae bacterium]